MALFRCASGSSGGGATITVIYSSDFYGETVTCSHGTKTYSKVATSSGTLEFSVDEEGTWTISSMGFSDTADVVLNYPAELVSLPDGETVLPTDDIETWLACAGITDKTYTALSQILADSETYNALLGDSNACAYMKRSTTWSTDICASQYAMNLLGQYDTACDALLSDATWTSAIANSTYWESVLNVTVPVMTSNTTPSGTASASSEYYGAYHAFSSASSNGWLATTQADSYVQYEFDTPIILSKVTYKQIMGGGGSSDYYTSETFDVKGSTDGTTFNPISTGITLNDTSVEHESVFENDTPYKIIRVAITSFTPNANTKGGGLKLQFYGRTSSSEKIHGGNPTYDSFYRIVDGNNVPVTDPSLLDAGTYTIYSNGLAKNPSDLSADYGKTIRICPNTKEIVVRPDNALYWWGYENPNLEDCTSANGWSLGGWTFVAPTHNNTSISMNSGSSKIYGVGSKGTVSGTTSYAVVNGITPRPNGYYFYLNTESSKAVSFTSQSGLNTSGVNTLSLALGSNKYICAEADGGSNADLYAMWYE
jgi:hypothetical protein